MGKTVGRWLGVPDAPDPNAVAAAQTTSNKDTATFNQGLGAVNVNTPGGTVTYVTDPTKKPGDPGYMTQTTALSPEIQNIYSQELGNQLKAGGLAGSSLDEVQALGPLNTSGLPANVTSVATPGMDRVGAGPGMGKVGAPTAGATAGGAAQAGQLATGTGGTQERVSDAFLPGYGKVSGAGQGIQRDLNYRSLGALPEASDETRRRVEQAQYDRQAMYLDPQFAREAAKQSAMLANKGIPVGSEAHAAYMQEFEDAKARAYQQARESAIVSGGAEQSRLISDALAIRGQGAREIENAGAYHNAAQGQGFGQGVTQTTTNNAAANQALADRIALTEQRNKAGQTEFSNQYQVTEQQNRAKQQDFDNQLKQLGFNNDVSQQQFQNTLSQMGFNNAADQQEFVNEVTRVTSNNSAAQQEFANLMSNANLTNAQRAQMFQELVTKYQLPLQKYSALFNSASVNPTVGTSVPIPTGEAKSTDIAGIQNNAFANQMKQWAAPWDLGLNLAKGGASAYGAYQTSDPRLKSDVERKGFLPSGLPWYEYTKGGKREQGVMSTDVKKFLPGAVKKNRAGYDMVDYSQIG